MARMVEEAQTRKAPVQALADRISGIFVPIVLLIALATLTGWVLAETLLFAATAAVAVLIIACPCASAWPPPPPCSSTPDAAQMGVIIAGPDVLERARAVKTIALDKTGTTVTRGDLRVVGVHPADGTAEAELLRLAGTAESGSEHPLAKAIVAASGELGHLDHFENVGAVTRV